jgi:hypothetical protein
MITSLASNVSELHTPDTEFRSESIESSFSDALILSPSFALLLIEAQESPENNCQQNWQDPRS